MRERLFISDNSGMAWLSGFADKAETLLNQLDKGAADVLNATNQPNHASLSM